MSKVNVSQRNKKIFLEIFDFIEFFILLVVPTSLLLSCFISNVTVEGKSMEPTLQDKDKIYLVSYIFTSPKQGDIVVVSNIKIDFKKDVENIIKRIIAVPGQKIKINFKKGEVFVDGNLLNEPYIKEITKNPQNMESNKELVIPEDHYFVMGDNRNYSTDSRSKYIGFVNKSDIIGKAKFRFLPLNSIRFF